MRVPVFCLGEILILNKFGREVNGYGRKPSKWFIGCEIYEKFEDALNRVLQIDDWCAENKTEGKTPPPPLVVPLRVQTIKEREQYSVDMVELVSKWVSE